MHVAPGACGKNWGIRERGNMAQKNKNEILHDHNNDGIDRRGFLKCMAWAGTGALCVMEGGILKSYSLSRVGEISAKEMAGGITLKLTNATPIWVSTTPRAP